MHAKIRLAPSAPPRRPPPEEKAPKPSEAQILAMLLERIHARTVSHSSEESEDVMTIMDWDSWARHEASPSTHIELPAYCLPCKSSLESSHSFDKHKTGTQHRKAARKELAERMRLLSDSDADDVRRSSSASPSPYSGPPRIRGGHRSEPVKTRSVEFSCSNLACRAKIKARPSDKAATCPRCNVKQAVQLPRH